jgi:hypothetical protein
MLKEESIDEILQLPQRKLVVAQYDIDLGLDARNEIFILMVEESSGSAGGRAAGSGSRRINRIYGFSCNSGMCRKYYETTEQQKIGLFDIPYSAVAMDIKLSTGKSFVVQGIVDPVLIEEYMRIVNTVV